MTMIPLKLIILLVVAAAGCSDGSSSPGIVEPDTATGPVNGRIIISELLSGGCGTSSRIISYAPDGTDPLVLVASGSNIMPAAAPDGRTILFSSCVGAVREVFAMDSNGANRRQLSFDTQGSNFTPVYSPDQQRIALSAVRDGDTNPEVWVMNADGTGATRLTQTPAALPGQQFVWSLHPTWSADGRQIAYASTASGSTQIWIMNSDGTDQRQLTLGLGSDYPDANVPHWSLDGSKIAFWSGFEGQYGDVWTMDPDGSNPVRITDTPDQVNSDDPHWSPDGTKIVFGCGGPEQPRSMWVIHLATRDESEILTGVQWADWQPAPQ